MNVKAYPAKPQTVVIDVWQILQPVADPAASGRPSCHTAACGMCYGGTLEDVVNRTISGFTEDRALFRPACLCNPSCFCFLVHSVFCDILSGVIAGASGTGLKLQHSSSRTRLPLWSCSPQTAPPPGLHQCKRQAAAAVLQGACLAPWRNWHAKTTRSLPMLMTTGAMPLSLLPHQKMAHQIQLLTKVPLRLPLPCLALPCPALPCPALPCPALPCPALPCLVGS